MRVVDKIAFGPFEFDLASGRLTKYGTRMKLQPRAAALLTRLLENPGETVTREQLQQRLWPEGTYVDFELGIKVAVKKVRDALGDSAEEPKYVQTIHGTGYRFIGTISVVKELESAPREAAATDLANDSVRAVEPVHTAAARPELSPAPLPATGRHGAARIVVLGAIIAAGITLLAGSVWHERIQISPPTPIQLTFNTVDVPVSAAALSPDGKLLAYADISGLYVRAFAEGSTHTLNVPSEVEFDSIAWAPDSANLYLAGASGVWRMSMFGPPAERITTTPLSFISVSPDGTMLLGKWDHGLWMVPTDGGSARLLVANPSSGDISRGVWSPDGRSIAYLRWTSPANQHLETRNVETGEIHVLPIGGLVCCWTPDNNILFSHSQPPPNRKPENLWQLHVTASGAADGTPVAVTGWPEFKFSSFSATPDAGMIAVVNTLRQSSVYVGDLDVRGARIDNLHRVTFKTKNGLPTAWDPDGRSLLLYASGPKGPFSMYRQVLGSTNAELLLDEPRQDNAQPHYSSDHQWILYVNMDDTLMRMPASGGPSEELFPIDPQTDSDQCATVPAPCVLAQIDHGKLTFSSFDPSVAGQKNPLPITVSEQRVAWSLSTDGQRIATLGADGAAIHVFKMSGELTATYRLPEPLSLTQLAWTQQGELVVTGRTKNGENQVLLVGGSEVRTLWSSRTQRLFSPVISADGTQIAFACGQTDSNVWLVKLH